MTALTFLQKEETGTLSTNLQPCARPLEQLALPASDTERHGGPMRKSAAAMSPGTAPFGRL